MKWVTATDIKLWAERLDSHSRLPELLRRLIHASVANPCRVDFPSGESVQTGGWDGLTEVAEPTTYVPSGYAGWELGAEKGAKGKADADYDKRSESPDGIDLSKATFVFVTPRRWPGKSKWTQEKMAEGRWAAVRCYDADDLESWLELCPAVGAWFAIQIGKYSAGVQSLDDLWTEFAQSTRPPLSAQLLLCGRDSAVRRVNEWQKGPPSSLVVEADSANEAAAFFAAAVVSLPESEKVQLLARTLVGTSPEAIGQIATSGKGLTIVWKSGDVSAVGSTIARGHWVLIPLGKGGASHHGDCAIVSLPRSPREQFVAALSACGAQEEKAQYLARETARSITVLQRRIPAARLSARPEWGAPKTGQDLIPVLLAGCWQNTRDADRNAVERLADTTYSQIEKNLARWVLVPDPPVRRIGEQWSLISPLDAWNLLSPLLTQIDLDRLEAVCMDVLGRDDPALALDPKDRWARNVYGKEFAHSGSLRSALAQTLALLLIVGHQTGGSAAASQHEPSVNRIVWRLLGEAADWRRWYSLSHLLPVIAEAVPETFLRALETDLARQEPHVVRLFEDEGDFGSSAHTGLLWALENLAWFPAHLGRVSVALAKLARLDPGGKLSNRPRNSLREIFLSWKPHTTATLEQRLQVIDLLLTKEDAVGWQLLLDLLPKGHDVATPTHEPRWREIPESKPTTWGERFAAASAIVDRAVSCARMRPERLAELVSQMGSFPPFGREALRLSLEKFSKQDTDPYSRSLVWDSVRDFANRHRKFSTSDWALPETELAKFHDLVEKLEPQDPIERFKWLFDDWWPDAPGTGDDHAENEATIEALRSRAVEITLAKMGARGIWALARAVKYPGFVGRTVAGIGQVGDLAVEITSNCLGSDDHALRILGMAFVSEYARLNRSERTVGMTVDRVSWSTRAQADFFLALSADLATWDCVEAASEEVQRQYWSQLQPFAVSQANPAITGRGVEQLLKFDRPLDALQVVAHKAQSLPSELLIKILDSVGRWINSGNLLKHRHSHPGYDVEQVLSSIRNRADVPRSELIRLEWFFLPFLEHGGTASAPTLHQALTDEPETFAQMIRWIFHPRNQTAGESEEKPTSDQDRQLAHQASDLLRSWTRVPGASSDGGLDEGELTAWVVKARSECERSGHAIIGDQQIGQMLAWAPADPDGIWPHRSVRSLLEMLESQEIETGLAIGVFNKRGFTSRAWNEGGKQEHILAAQCRSWSEATATAWPRVSAVLLSVSHDYDGHARREDEDAERSDLRY